MVLADRFGPTAEERDGEYADSRGRTYDQLGDPRSSRYWNDERKLRFFDSIMKHVRKSVDFTIMDLTGFSEESTADITGYVDGLPADQQAKIIRMGF